MTDEEILVRATTCGIYETDSDYWECWEKRLLEFARAMLREGYYQGVNDGLGHD